MCGLKVVRDVPDKGTKKRFLIFSHDVPAPEGVSPGAFQYFSLLQVLLV